MEKKEIKYLLKKYDEGRCSEEEKALLDAWYRQYNEAPVNMPFERIRELGLKIFESLPVTGKRQFSRGVLLRAAAIGAIIFSLTIQFYFHKQGSPVGNYQQDIAPGGNRAMLTLANGKKIDLAQAATGTLLAAQGFSIQKNAAGQILYQVSNGTMQNEPAGENNLRTPKGGIWEVHLPDGTKVWLNNSSSLTYPSSFKNTMSRIVKLEGEAYFEVAKDNKHVFIVKSGSQEVKVDIPGMLTT